MGFRLVSAWASDWYQTGTRLVSDWHPPHTMHAAQRNGVQAAKQARRRSEIERDVEKHEAAVGGEELHCLPAKPSAASGHKTIRASRGTLGKRAGTRRFRLGEALSGNERAQDD